MASGMTALDCSRLAKFGNFTPEQQSVLLEGAHLPESPTAGGAFWRPAEPLCASSARPSFRFTLVYPPAVVNNWSREGVLTAESLSRNRKRDRHPRFSSVSGLEHQGGVLAWPSNCPTEGAGHKVERGDLLEGHAGRQLGPL